MKNDTSFIFNNHIKPEYLRYIEFLLISQLFPWYPEGQTHVYESSPSIQLPPLRHGIGSQSLKSTRN